MFSLSKKPRLEKEDDSKKKRISVRDLMLVKEIPEMKTALSRTCKLLHPDNFEVYDYYDFIIIVAPEEGYWKGGRFHFQILVTEEYNFAPPTVKCLTKLWHPNIGEDGAVCLSLLRQSSSDGWSPARRLKDVVWGLNSLFTDLLNFEDPLNNEASEMFKKSEDKFRAKVQDYIERFSPRP